MDADKIAALRAIATDAPATEWVWAGDYLVVPEEWDEDGFNPAAVLLKVSAANPPKPNVARFIATVNPSVVKALLDVVEALEWYADSSNYRNGSESPACLDSGDQAQHALATLAEKFP